MDGCKSHFKDCLQQSKRDNNVCEKEAKKSFTRLQHDVTRWNVYNQHCHSRGWTFLCQGPTEATLDRDFRLVAAMEVFLENNRLTKMLEQSEASRF